MSIWQIMLNIVGMLLGLMIMVAGYAIVVEHPVVLTITAAVVLGLIAIFRIRRRKGT